MLMLQNFLVVLDHFSKERVESVLVFVVRDHKEYNYMYMIILPRTNTRRKTNKSKYKNKK